MPKNVGDLGKLIVFKGFKNLPKVQKIAQSGHTGWITQTWSHDGVDEKHGEEEGDGDADDEAKSEFHFNAIEVSRVSKTLKTGKRRQNRNEDFIQKVAQVSRFEEENE